MTTIPDAASDDFADMTANRQAQRDSRELVGVLKRHRARLGASAELPPETRELDQQVLSAARSRSQEIRADEVVATPAGLDSTDHISEMTCTNSSETGIPIWMLVMLVIAAVVLLLLVLAVLAPNLGF